MAPVLLQEAREHPDPATVIAARQPPIPSFIMPSNSPPEPVNRDTKGGVACLVIQQTHSSVGDLAITSAVDASQMRTKQTQMHRHVASEGIRKGGRGGLIGSRAEKGDSHSSLLLLVVLLVMKEVRIRMDDRPCQ